MRIKKLELIGFKSFKDRTVIQFDEGITGIVGPNGCGKSNIVDALVWVMGEMSAKHLRGSNMSDVIFAGAENYAPVGMAEVSLVLENDGGPFPAKYLKHSEVMITRRLHRSGESEYLINKEAARLRDIQEIFMDTGAGSKGFSIIEQGAIGKIITAKPSERRSLIEEAAGITKFKVRKRESQRKLVQTDQNLVRLQDIIGEQKRQLDSLQRQAQRAERYKNLKDEVEQKDVWLSSKQYLAIHDDTVHAQTQFDEAKESEAASSSQLSEIQNNLESLRADVTAKETLVQDKQTQFQELQRKVNESEVEIRELNFEIEQARRNKEMTGSIVEKYTARREALVKDRNEFEQKLNDVREVADRLTEQFETKNENFQEVQARITAADDELTDKRREMLTVSSSETHLAAKQESMAAQINELTGQTQAQREQLAEVETKKADIEKHRNKVFADLEKERQLQLDVTKDVETLEENMNTLEAQVEERRTEAETFKDQLNEVTSRLYGLEDLHANFEGFQEGVKSVMLWQRQKMETHADGSMSASPVTEFQPMAEVVEVDQDYELAMESALGQRLQMLLSDDSKESLEAVSYLKENNSGRSSFMAADVVSQSSQAASEGLRNEDGVDRMLSDVVRVPDRYKNQITQFLKDVVIVNDIRTALRLRGHYPGCTFVTREGDTLTNEGVLTGGTVESAQSGVLKRRREIKELSQRREEFAGKLSLAQATLKKMAAQLEGVEEQVEEAKKRHSEKEVAVAELRKDLERAENELQMATAELERKSNEVNQLESKLQTQQEAERELTEQLEQARARKASLDEDVERLTRELESSRMGIDQLQEDVSQLRVDSASKRQECEGLQHQYDMVSESLAEVESQLAQMTDETEKSAASLTENQVLVEQQQVGLEAKIREAKELELHVGQVKDNYELAATDLRKAEASVNEMLQGQNEFQAKMNEAQLKLEQLRMKEQYLIDQINERYMKDLVLIAAEYKDIEGDVEATEKEVEDLKSKLKRIGEVNLSAIEEYNDLIERYEFLSKQYEDLVDSKEQLRKVIERINRICSRRFKDTFEQVNERFIKVFPVLFGGGEARLVLVENEEKDEVGIDIIARPPGKKAANVSLLSGGEKALTAVSLIFSIFLVKPSPFCLLDEVDAPLDDANVNRFNDLVKEMAKRSQIIIVTHNKHTMKVNNKLFGVTQEEKGVSKMVSVSLDQMA